MCVCVGGVQRGYEGCRWKDFPGVHGERVQDMSALVTSCSCQRRDEVKIKDEG